jgi:hypothetical protein
MLFISVISWEPDKRDELAKRTLKMGGGALPKGMKRLGEWTVIGGHQGFQLLDVEDPRVMYEVAREWTDIMSIEYFPVLETGEVRKIIADKIGKK